MIIDHLVYACPSLAIGMRQIESLLNVQPTLGGSHPSFGTHNALVALGESTYLEIVAPDPNLSEPARGRWLTASCAAGPMLATWALRHEPISSPGNDLNLTAEQHLFGPIETGSRTKPNGSELTWHLTDPYLLPMDGAIPFLISWGDTPHPAQDSIGGGDLVQLIIEHPKPERISHALGVLPPLLQLRRGSTFRLLACIRTIEGSVVWLPNTHIPMPET